MYIDAGFGQSNPIILTVITSGPSFPRTWRIRVTQIPCDSISKADQGCLQWHMGVYGRVRSFNFDPSTGAQLANQDYSVCVRTEKNFCSIQYSVCPDPGKILSGLEVKKKLSITIKTLKCLQLATARDRSHCRVIRTMR